jgi:CDP-diacylglycerol---serine O-phosphatidyltransferase
LQEHTVMNDSKLRSRKSRRRLRNIAVLPSLITLMNGLCGFAAIHFAARGMNEPEKLWFDKPELTFFAAAAWMIFFAMVADAVDGFVARRSGSTSNFGGQLDSLADVISFGVAPAFLMLRVVESGLQASASPLFGNIAGRLLWLTAALYVCCAILRLARFNVENAPEESAHLKFSGLPTPAAAGVIAAWVLLYSDLMPELREQLPGLSWFAPVIIYLLPFLTAGVALLMVSRVPYLHVVNQFIRGRRPFEYLVILIFLILLLIWRLQLTLAIGSVAYAMSGAIQWLRQRKKKVESKEKKVEGGEL